MPCYTPLKAYRAEGGRVEFSSRKGFIDRPFDLACGQCMGCRVERSRQWALRCVHEAQLHERNSYVTLTYRPEDVPADGSLNVTDWQKFAKRVRRELGPFRFLQCGEYGERNFRPHHHACVFGLDFGRSDWVPWKKNASGDVVYTSEKLEEKWQKGFCTIGELTWQSAAYVARYCMKKATGELAKERYRRIDLETGEEYFVKPEYITMSRRPGLAAEWFEKFKDDVYPDDFVVHAGKKQRVPKFYDDMLDREDPEELARLRAKRKDAVYRRKEELGYERLRVREEVHLARLSRLRRDL